MKLLVLMVSLLSFGCASTHRGRTLQTMAVASAAGIAYGLSRPSQKQENALLFGGISAAAAGTFGMYVWDAEQEVTRLRDENLRLTEELGLIKSPHTLAEVPATFNAKIPAKYRSLVQPGSWRVSEIDQWVEDGENRLIHQGLIMELIPPSLNPSHSTGGSK